VVGEHRPECGAGLVRVVADEQLDHWHGGYLAFQVTAAAR
jgi:hypothetical protein